MAFNNHDLKRINALIALKDTMLLSVYIEKLTALRHDIVSDIVVEAEVEHGEKTLISTVHKIIKPNLN